MEFNADKYLVPDKWVRLGERDFLIPIIPAITSLIINKNPDAYARFGTPDEDEEARKVAFEVIASILNQRIPIGERIDDDWVGNNLDMRIMNEFLFYIFSKDEEGEKKNTEKEGEAER